MTEENLRHPDIVPVILSGGSGSRLWPLSRSSYPKQFLNLSGELTMIQETASRVIKPGYAAPLFVSNKEHRFLLAEQMRSIGIQPAGILLEPEGRNTAAAIAAAALVVAETEPTAPMLVLPSDHVIDDMPAFDRMIACGLPLAQEGNLALFGVVPDHAATGYGYILQGDAAGKGYEVASFVEKPDLPTAETYLASGDYLWNSGMFLFRADVILKMLERYEPELLTAVREAVEGRHTDLDFELLEPEAFAEAPSLPIDIAVMERTDKAVVIPASIGWDDIGAWSALWDRAEKDTDNNAVFGDVMLHEASGCYVRADQTLIAAVGVQDLVITDTGDAVLVAHKDKVQNVSAVVKRLKADCRDEAEHPPLVHRPWGTFKTVDVGDRFRVKEIMVSPGRRLSIQRHNHRAEHWVVVEGTARVLHGEDWKMVYENQSIFIPMGTVHCLENPGKIPLRLIEVQSGAYLGEDDIERLNDVYGRV